MSGTAQGPLDRAWLPEDQEATFRTWAKRLGVVDPDDPQQFYDYRAAYLAKAQPDETGHWPSEFKLEGHPDLVVGGYDTRTGEPRVPYRQERDVEVLVGKGWPRRAAELMVKAQRGGL